MNFYYDSFGLWMKNKRKNATVVKHNEKTNGALKLTLSHKIPAMSEAGRAVNPTSIWKLPMTLALTPTGAPIIEVTKTGQMVKIR